MLVVFTKVVVIVIRCAMTVDDDSIVELVLCIIILLPVRARILTVGVKLPGGTSW